MLKALGVGATALGLLFITGCQKSPDLDQSIHSYLMAHPEVLREAGKKLAENEQAAATRASAAAVPQHRDQLERDPRDVVLNPEGKVTVVQFYDYRCGFCKLAAPEVATLVRENPDVRFVFKQFPIFGSVSDTAAKIALTAPVKARSLDIYAAWMAASPLDDAALDRGLRKAGLDAGEVRRLSASPKIAQQIADTRALAKALKLEGTPTFIVGDRVVAGADMAALRAAIAASRGGARRG